MAELQLVQVIMTLGLIAITGAFAFVLKKVGTIAVWGLTSTLMIISLNFGYNYEIIMALAAISFLVETITVVIDG